MSVQSPPGAHAICLTLGEVIFGGCVFALGVGVVVLEWLVFNQYESRFFPLVISAVQGCLFWSVVLIGSKRLFGIAYRGLRRRVGRQAD